MSGCHVISPFSPFLSQSSLPQERRGAAPLQRLQRGSTAAPRPTVEANERASEQDTAEARGGRRAPPRGKGGVGVAAVVGEELAGRGPRGGRGSAAAALAHLLPPAEEPQFRSAGRRALACRPAPPLCSALHHALANRRALARRLRPPPHTRPPPLCSAGRRALARRLRRPPLSPTCRRQSISSVHGVLVAQRAVGHVRQRSRRAWTARPRRPTRRPRRAGTT
jgi:hypothetical protein